MLEWPEETLFQGIASVAADHPDRTALVFEGKEYTYAELIEESESVARGLANLGVREGDVIATWLGNRPEWVVCQLAASALGAGMVAVNTRYRTHELEYMLADSGASVLVTEESFLDSDYHEMLADLLPELREDDPESFESADFPDLDAVVSLESDPDYSGIRDYETVRQGDTPDQEALDVADDSTAPVAVFYTSGTTSDPKGCLQSSRSLLNHSYNVARYLGVDASDTSVSMLPFCGIWGYNHLFSVLSTGGTLVVRTHFDPEDALAAIDEHDVTYVAGLAVMFRRVMGQDGFAPERASSIEHGVVGFISLGYDETLFERIESEFGFPLVQPYGLSEANSQVFVGDPADPIEQRKRVGGRLVHPDIETKVVDPETREPVPSGERGELAIRGYCVMDEYHDKPDENAAAMDEDWFYTGDLCSIDEEGYHYYHSRLDDALRTRGFLVSPREIEAGVDEIDGVEWTEVVGAPHPRHGEVPVAFVQRADDALTETDLRAALADRVADYKVPETVQFVEEFPTTEGPNGEKVQKGRLRDRVADLFVD